jgi:hypothetical protein
VLGNFDPHNITGCVLSSLLSARREELPPTVGLVGPGECLDHHQALERLGFQSALHCEGYTPDEGDLAGFRRRFGHEGNPGVTPR